MKKLSLLLFLFTACLSLSASAQEISGDNGKTYYDAAKTKPKEVYSYREVYTINPNDPKHPAVSHQKEGPYFFYYETGKLKISGQYKMDKKEGDWKYYDEQGKLTKTEKYSNGELAQ